MDSSVEKFLTVSVAEVKSRIDDVLKAVDAGNTVVLTRNGRSVAKLSPSLKVSQAEAPRGAQKGGLASLAGGWEGSDELADLIEEMRRARR